MLNLCAWAARRPNYLYVIQVWSQNGPQELRHALGVLFREFHLIDCAKDLTSCFETRELAAVQPRSKMNLHETSRGWYLASFTSLEAWHQIFGASLIWMVWKVWATYWHFPVAMHVPPLRQSHTGRPGNTRGFTWAEKGEQINKFIQNDPTRTNWLHIKKHSKKKKKKKKKKKHSQD